MILEEFIGKYQINLTKQQLEGVTSIEMPTLLLAVPGDVYKRQPMSRETSKGVEILESSKERKRK